ncbi:hypothetical protein MLD38_010949 [Melastoma candidum]|uniref:Uncharacterized protein n=1 Tax=Melastoma candidum TaxID=119954 RepID=A0ACB9R5N2_9MYRT|nr:hypothetical protein MLD38_010949 [Melastoma candidum]
MKTQNLPRCRSSSSSAPSDLIHILFSSFSVFCHFSPFNQPHRGAVGTNFLLLLFANSSPQFPAPLQLRPHHLNPGLGLRSFQSWASLASLTLGLFRQILALLYSIALVQPIHFPSNGLNHQPLLCI